MQKHPLACLISRVHPEQLFSLIEVFIELLFFLISLIDRADESWRGKHEDVNHFHRFFFLCLQMPAYSEA